jgi:hypothetical protein
LPDIKVAARIMIVVQCCKIVVTMLIPVNNAVYNSETLSNDLKIDPEMQSARERDVFFSTQKKMKI